MLLGLVRRIDERRKAHVRLFPAGSRAHVTLSSLVQGRMANLSTAGLTDEDVPALTVVLRRNTNLAWLNLDHNRLTDMGLARLLHPLLEGAPALEALNLGYTLLTAVGLELLAPVLVRKRTLQLVGLARVAGIHRNEPHPTLRWSRSWRHFAVEILDELEPADPRGEVGIRRHESTPLAIFQGESESLIPRGEFAFYCACVHLARGEVPSAGAVLTGAVLTLQEPLDDIAFLLSATYAVDRPTACLLGIYIAQLCDARAGAIRNVTPVDARKFDEVSSSTQLAVRALLQLTPDTEALRLLMRDDMWDVSEMAAESNCRVLLASGQLQMAHVNAFFGNFGSFIHRSLPMLGRRWPHMPATSRVKLVVAVLAFLLVHAVLEPLVYLLIIFVPQCEVYFVHPPPWFCTIIDRMACKESWLSNGRPLVLRMWAVDPFVRFGASWVLDMLLAGLIMSLPPPDRTDMWSIDALWRYVHGQRDQETWQLALKQMPPGSMVLALVWVPAALLGEFTQLLALGFTKEPALALHRYLIEVWNWFDVCGLVTALVGLLLYTAVAMGEAPTGGAMRWAEAQSTAGEAELDPFEDQVRTVQATLAMATWLLWIRALRVTYLVPELGAHAAPHARRAPALAARALPRPLRARRLLSGAPRPWWRLCRPADADGLLDDEGRGRAHHLWHRLHVGRRRLLPRRVQGHAGRGRGGRLPRHHPLHLLLAHAHRAAHRADRGVARRRVERAALPARIAAPIRRVGDGPGLHGDHGGAAAQHADRAGALRAHAPPPCAARG